LPANPVAPARIQEHVHDEERPPWPSDRLDAEARPLDAEVACDAHPSHVDHVTSPKISLPNAALAPSGAKTGPYVASPIRRPWRLSGCSVSGSTGRMLSPLPA